MIFNPYLLQPLNFYFYFSKPLSDIPFIKNINEYQAIIVALTFSNLFEKDDFSHFFLFARNWDEVKINNLFEQYCSNVTQAVEKIANLSPNIPIFFTSFINESVSLQGMFKDFYGSADITHFIYRINRFLYQTITEYPQMYLIDMDKILNQISTYGVRDDTILYTSHFSWIIDGADHLDANRLSVVEPPVVYFGTKDKMRELSQVFWDYMEIMFKSLDPELDKIKLIITDLDGTLWRGVAAEDDLNALERIIGWNCGYVEALLEFKNRGGLLAVCSKNDETPTLEKLDSMFFGQITQKDFVLLKINWQSKSQNIKTILDEVNLLPQNVLFIDDNPREIDEVVSAFPTIKTLSQRHYLWRLAILQAPELQFPHVSTESKNRTESIKASILNKSNQSQFDNKQDWLFSLNIQQRFIDITDIQNPHFNRTFELLNKTNQFNTTGKRWSLPEIQQFFDNNGYAVAMFLKDRTVEYGLVGLILIENNKIIQMVMSCRVFELRAEQEFLRYVAINILAHYPNMTAHLIETGRNQSCLQFYSNMGFHLKNNQWVSTQIPQKVEWIESIE